MADVYMKSKFYFKRGKATSWTAQNIILGPGEPGFELDTGKLKVGNGVTPWNELEYITDNIVLPAEAVKYLGSVGKLPEDAFDGEICEIDDMFYIHSQGQWKQIGGTAAKPGVVEVIKIRDDGSPNPTVESNGVKYNSIEDALANVSDGDLIVIPANFNSVISIPANKSAGIELKNINVKNDEETPLTVGYQSTLTVSGAGTMECRKHAKPTVMNSGNMYITGGEYIRTLDSSKNGYYTVVNHGNMTFNGGLVSCDKEYSSLIENGYWDYSDSDPAKGFVAGQNEVAPKLTINNGSFIGGLYIIKNDDNGYVEINGGDFYGTIYTCGKLLTINGGNFRCDDYYNLRVRKLNDGMNIADVVITGGTFDCPASDFNVLIEQDAKVTIKGGKFNCEVPAALIAEGYQAQLIDNYYEVSAIE